MTHALVVACTHALVVACTHALVVADAAEEKWEVAVVEMSAAAADSEEWKVAAAAYILLDIWRHT